MIYLDMDGVISNLLAGVCRLFELDYDTTYKNWPKGQYNIVKALHTIYRGTSHLQKLPVDDAELWDSIGNLGELFWTDMITPYDHAVELYESLARIDTVMVATQPTTRPESFSGKIKWLQKLFGSEFNDYVFTTRKQVLAAGSALLLDDNEKFCQNFALFGGQTIVVPRPWNHCIEPAELTEYLIGSVKKWSTSYSHYQKIVDGGY